MKRGNGIAATLPNDLTAGYSLRMDTIPAVVIDEDARLKAAFAAALFKHPATMEGRFAAALSVTSDTGKALVMANKWLDDPEVIAQQQRMTKGADEGDLNFIGTKADFAREILKQARTQWDGETKLKFYKLYAETRGFIVKEGTNVNVQVNNNRVMVVKDMGSDDDWERKAQQQQRALIDVSASRH